MDRPRIANKKGQRMKVKFVINKITRTINHSATNCLGQSNVQVL
jgi:hypothetical protein